MKGPLIYYEIKEMYGSDLSSTKLSSELRQSVLEEIELGFNVEVDFKDVRSITNGWGRNFIGKIAKDKGTDFVKNHIMLSNMNKNVRTNLLEGISDILEIS
jgi:cell division GTPase FtsZ